MEELMLSLDLPTFVTNLKRGRQVGTEAVSRPRPHPFPDHH